MKKRVFLISLVFVMTALVARAQQDTVVAWTFPTGNLTDTISNIGIASNLGTRTLMHEGGTGLTQMIAGDGTYAEQVTNWDNGDSTKFWSIKFKAEGYHNLLLYSKQKSDATDFGPKDWKVQYKWGAIPWTNITGGTITCSNDWSGGVINALSIPITVPGATSIYIRWIMTSNTSTNNVAVTATGKSAIDNIIIMGTADQPVVITGDTITGWDFIDNTDTTFNADMGLVGNMNYDIRAEDSAGIARTLTYTNGATNYAATATGWDAGDSIKFWSIKFKANDLMDMKVYSKQSSGGSTPGPKYWKLQYYVSPNDWADIPGGSVTVANDWTTGVISGLALPSSLNNPGTASIHLRWVMASNESSGGGAVLSTGISKIDDILVTGTSTAGITTVIYDNRVGVYPNPCRNTLNIESSEEIAVTEIYNILGARVYSSNSESQNLQVNVANFDAGLYVVVLHFNNESKVVTRKVLVQ
jgi:hypothetical protein